METTTSSFQTTPETEPSVWKLGSKNGLITGLVLFIFTLIFTYILEIYVAWWLNLIPFIVYAIAIVMTHKAYKEEGDGFMAYGKGLGLATILGAVAGLVVGVLAFLYVNVIDPTIPEKQADAVAEFQVEMMESFGASDADIDKVMDEQRSDQIATAQNPFLSVGTQILGGIIIAFFLSLIISIFTKNNHPEYEI